MDILLLHLFLFCKVLVLGPLCDLPLNRPNLLLQIGYLLDILIDTFLDPLPLLKATIGHVNGHLLQAVQSIDHREQSSELCLWTCEGSSVITAFLDELQIFSSLNLLRFVTPSEE